MSAGPPDGKPLFLSAVHQLSRLKEVDGIIRGTLNAEVAALPTISAYLLDLGGKRLRPLLCLQSAQACGLTKDSTALLEVSAALELVHMATLLHDDIIDRATLRRRQTSPLHRFGLGPTLLTGDFLLVRAFGLCARQDEHIINATEKACVELVEGEILESNLLEEKHSLAAALLIAEKKTAALFSLAMRCGAHLAGADTEVVEKLSTAGRALGIAFQICDDILDVTGDEATFGKQCGTDLRERKPSVVNVLWLASGSVRAQTLVEPPGAEEEAFIRAALADLKQSTVMDQARDLAIGYAQTAAEALHRAIPEPINRAGTEALANLNDLIKYISNRIE